MYHITHTSWTLSWMLKLNGTLALGPLGGTECVPHMGGMNPKVAKEAVSLSLVVTLNIYSFFHSARTMAYFFGSAEADVDCISRFTLLLHGFLSSGQWYLSRNVVIKFP